jgi:hypothetical protein
MNTVTNTVLAEVLTNTDARTTTTLSVIASNNAEAFAPWFSVE